VNFEANSFASAVNVKVALEVELAATASVEPPAFLFEAAIASLINLSI